MQSNIVFFAIICMVLQSACTAVKSAEAEAPISKKNIYVSGTVERIEAGKDGYTADIRTPNDQLFVAIVSIPNLGSMEQFRELEVDKQVTLKGESRQLADESRLIARNIISTDNQHFEVSGEVHSLKYGVDGYTAKIIRSDKEIFYATISIPNLGEQHSKYREFKPGEPITVVGELWLLGHELQITVRDIKI